MTSVDFRLIPVLFGMIPLFFTSTDIVDLCPLTRFCKDRGNQTPDTWHQPNSCCLPCSCHKNCKLVGTCCHDADVDGSLQQMYTCTSQQDIYNKYLSLSGTSTLESYVRVITDCHGDKFSIDTLFQCRNAGSIEDLKFVTGKTSGITYLNKHCALCNGEDDFDIWTLYMVSGNADVIFSADASYKSRDEYLVSTGRVKSVPPTHFARLSTLCSIKEKDKCNLSSKWDIYNKETEDNCNAYTSTFYGVHSKLFYKNPFCYMCNQSPLILNNISRLNCEVLLNDDDTRTTIGPFTALIQTTRKDDVSDVKSSKPCSYGETMDIFFGKCTSVLCPPGTVVIEDRCQPLFEDDSGIGMIVHFNFEIRSSILVSRSIFVRLLPEIRAMIVSKVKEYEPHCDFCRALLNYKFSQFTVSVVFVSSRGCSYLQYIKQIARIHRQTPIRLFSESIQGNVILNAGNEPTDNQMEISEIRTNYTGRCMPSVTFSEDIIPCASIIISKDDLNALPLNLSVKNEILNLGTRVGNGTLRVCLEDYNELYAHSSLASGTYIFYMNWMLTTSLLQLHYPGFVLYNSLPLRRLF